MSRKALGAYFTPPHIAGEVVGLGLGPLLARRVAQGVAAVASLRIVDPACGTGNLLVAAVDQLMEALRGLELDERTAADIAVRCVEGVEIDAGTARECRARLQAISPDFVADQIACGDGLDPRGLRNGSFDLVIGNPPFLTQLRTATTHSAGRQAALRDRFGAAVGAYTDPAALFLALGHQLARPDGGVVAMIEPTSILTSRDARVVRRAVLDDAALTDLWVMGGGVFDAAVEVCTIVLQRSSDPARTQLHAGVPSRPGPSVAAPTADASSWSDLLAAHAGLPHRVLATDGRLGDLADATADFRDQYYGLVPHVVDRAEADEVMWPRLATTGLIDPGRLAWGERPARFAKQRFAHPRIDRAGLVDRMASWAEARLVPKVLLATQTRVLEAVVDADGTVLPSVPVISVVPRAMDDLWRVAAVLTCPAVAAEAAQRHLGSGRTSRSLRLRATEVLDLPLPADRKRWDAAAGLLFAGAPLAAVGGAMDAAYRVDDGELLDWWLGLLPGP